MIGPGCLDASIVGSRVARRIDAAHGSAFERRVAALH